MSYNIRLFARPCYFCKLGSCQTAGNVVRQQGNKHQDIDTQLPCYGTNHCFDMITPDFVRTVTNTS